MTVTESGYRGPRVCRVVGITYRQLDYWARTGLVRPSVRDAAGSGTQRVYSYADVIDLGVIKHLRAAGLSLRTARLAVECIRDQAGENRDLDGAALIVEGSEMILARDAAHIVRLLRRGRGIVHIVFLGSVQDEVDERIDAEAI